MMKTKFLTGAAAATILLLGAAGAHANPLSIFNDAPTTQTVTSAAAAAAGGGGGAGGAGGILGGGGAGGAASQTNTSTAVSESYNSPNLAVTNNELSNTAATNNNLNLALINLTGENQTTGEVRWQNNGMQNAAGVFGQGANTAQAGAAQGNANVTAVAFSSFDFD